MTRDIAVRLFTEADLIAVAAIHSQAFERQKQSQAWIGCNAAAYPRMRYYVALQAAQICGYILWTEKSGFRQQVVLELEQIAVAPSHQRQGIGAQLIRASLTQVATALSARGAMLKKLLVTTGTNNHAQQLYRTVLGARLVATIPALFVIDEVVLIADYPLAETGDLG
jgi:ribosomal protein S18 acetylase RimI-like enzyme